VVEVLNRLQPVYLHVIEGETSGARDIDPSFDFHALRRMFQRTYMANNGYTFELATTSLKAGSVDLVAFGVPFIANADLVDRFRKGAALNVPDPATYYGEGAKGYTDYPSLGATLESGSWAADTRGGTSVLDGDEVSRIDHSMKRQDSLYEALDNDIASDEEDQELREEDRVEAAADANGGS
jgi:hypothetical protein